MLTLTSSAAPIASIHCQPAHQPSTLSQHPFGHASTFTLFRLLMSTGIHPVCKLSQEVRNAPRMRQRAWGFLGPGSDTRNRGAEVATGRVRPDAAGKMVPIGGTMHKRPEGVRHLTSHGGVAAALQPARAAQPGGGAGALTPASLLPEPQQAVELLQVELQASTLASQLRIQLHLRGHAAGANRGQAVSGLHRTSRRGSADCARTQGRAGSASGGATLAGR